MLKSVCCLNKKPLILLAFSAFHGIIGTRVLKEQTGMLQNRFILLLGCRLKMNLSAADTKKVYFRSLIRMVILSKILFVFLKFVIERR